MSGSTLSIRVGRFICFPQKKTSFELGQQKGTCKRKHPGFLGE